MSTGNAPQDEADLEALLIRKSPLSKDYDNLGQVEPSAALDAKILLAAKAAARPVPKAQPTGSGSIPAAGPAPPKAVPVRRPEPVSDDDADDDLDEVPVARRPRWMVPVALAASVLVAVGIGFAVLDSGPSVKEEKSGSGSQFAKRARERSEAEKVASEAAAAEEADAMVLEAPPPPPPVFGSEGPQVADLDAAIALIRRELILADRQEAPVEALPFSAAPDAAVPSASSEEALADTAVIELPAAPASGASVIQSRNRRLAKVLELYDTGNPYLAEDALEIFLRDFADDPISQRILEIKP